MQRVENELEKATAASDKFKEAVEGRKIKDKSRIEQRHRILAEKYQTAQINAAEAKKKLEQEIKRRQVFISALKAIIGLKLPGWEREAIFAGIRKQIEGYQALEASYREYLAGLSQYPILAQLVEEILDYLDNLPAEYSYAQRLAEIERRVKYIENLPDTIVGQAKGKLEEAEKIVIEAPRKIYENPEATEWFSGEAATAEKKADDLREQLKMAQVTAAILRQILPVAPDENLSQVAPSPEQEIFLENFGG